eukprot:2956612-Karenia_brevis.AAC.1
MVRDAGMAELRQMWTGIKKAEAMVVEQTHPRYQDVGLVLESIYWSRKVWCREDRIDYEKADWKLTEGIRKRAYDKWSAARHSKTTAEDQHPQHV